MQAGCCQRCGRPALVGPLHLEKGGPLVCLPCGIEIHARIRRKEKREKLRNRLQRADLDEAFGVIEEFGAAPDELCLELLNDAIRLTHPDRHPPERADLAQRVTEGLLALRPFTLPREKRRDVGKPTPSVPKTARTVDPELEALRNYPCGTCKNTTSPYYCDVCSRIRDKLKAADDEKRERRRQREKEQQRRWREQRKLVREWTSRKRHCVVCNELIKGKRKDAKTCSPACRQRAFRDASRNIGVGPVNSRNDAPPARDTSEKRRNFAFDSCNAEAAA